MSVAIPAEIHFLLDSAGALIVFQETGASWAGVLGFSSAARAREFCRASNLEVAELASIVPEDQAAVASLINSVKRRAVRNLILDLDYKTGACVQVEFEGDALGAAALRQLEPGARPRGKS